MPNTLGGRKVGHVLDIELATGVAVAEVEERRVGVTQQFFSVHDPVMAAGRPQVVGVESESGSGEALVYFSVAGEPYHFWVRVGSSDRGPVVAFSGYRPASDVGFVVTSRELSPDALTKHIGLVPTGVRTMGSLVREGAVPFPTNQWRFEPPSRGVLPDSWTARSTRCWISSLRCVPLYPLCPPHARRDFRSHRDSGRRGLKACISTPPS